MNKRENEVELKQGSKKQRKMQKGVGITPKLLLILLLPMFIISIFNALLSANKSWSMADELLKEQLAGATEGLVSAINAVDAGNFSCKNNVLYKGSTDLTIMNEYIDSLNKEVGIGFTVFWGDTRVLTTLQDAEGNRLMLGTQLNAELASTILSGNVFYDGQNVTNGTKYCVYYKPFYQPGSNEAVGIILASKQRQAVVSTITQNIIENLLLIVCVILVATTLGVLVIRKLTSSIKSSVGNLESIANGNLTVTVADKLANRGDEMGEIARSVKSVVTQMKLVIENIVVSSDSISSFTDEFKNAMTSMSGNITNINRVIDEIAKGASSQADETMQANTEVHEIGIAIEKTASEVELLNKSADTMNQYSVTAENTLGELLTISESTRESVAEVKDQTNITNQSAIKIQTATDLITDIASQTNLLSLNASIEAARAGEAGRGFSVVADEIRKLAEQSGTSAAEINTIIRELIENSNTSVVTMDKVSGNIEEQRAKLDETKQVFEHLNREVGSIAKAVEDISRQTENLEIMKSKIVSIVETLAAIAEENLASTEETASTMSVLMQEVEGCDFATKNLVDLVAGLNEQANKFKVR